MESTLPKNLAEDFSPEVGRRHNAYRSELPVTRYSSCYVTHSGIGLKRLRLIPETSWANVPRRWAIRELYRYALYKYLTEPRVRRAEPDLLLLHNHWASGYHHWVTECLVKLQFIHAPDYTVLMPEDYPSFAAESLALFDFRSIKRIPARHGLRPSELTLVSNPNSGYFDPAHLAWLREQCIDRCDGQTKRRPQQKRIYITRAGDRMRRVENEDQVVAVLEAYDFQTVDCGSLTFCEQVQMFSHCETLVSIHGAGLTNCVFMPEHGRVLELYRALVDGPVGMNRCYWYLVSAAGLDYYYQFCRHGRNWGDRIDDVNVVVDVEKLTRNVELMLV